MIRYSLVCKENHEFEGWFGSSEDFDAQEKRKLVSCPVCGSSAVSKALMAPGLSGTKKQDNLPVAAPVNMATVPPQLPQELVNKLREIKKEVEKTAENVGDKFPEEARKIHYGEAEARGIYGKTSLEEAANLVEEGVNVMPLPDLPEDKN